MSAGTRRHRQRRPHLHQEEPQLPGARARRAAAGRRSCAHEGAEAVPEARLGPGALQPAHGPQQPPVPRAQEPAQGARRAEQVHPGHAGAVHSTVQYSTVQYSTVQCMCRPSPRGGLRSGSSSSRGRGRRRRGRAPRPRCSGLGPPRPRSPRPRCPPSSSRSSASGRRVPSCRGRAAPATLWSTASRRSCRCSPGGATRRRRSWRCSRCWRAPPSTPPSAGGYLYLIIFASIMFNTQSTYL